MNSKPTRIALPALVILTAPLLALAPADRAPSSSLMAQPSGQASRDGDNHALRRSSMFAIAPELPRTFQRHDLVQIIVREQSEARSRHEVETDKDYRLQGAIPRFPQFSLPELLQLQLQAGRTQDMPELRLNFSKEFSGDGEVRRRDDFSARITAEVIEVLPNGNLVLEARTFIKTDREESVMKVTGVCRQEDITPLNTVLSNQLHNLTVEKMHKGDLRDATDKGIIARVLDAVFAF
jgi:flagellar L-ring protein precursor FlgH